MEIEKINPKENEEIKAVFVEAVLMPNGELIRNGKTIGWGDQEGIFARTEKKILEYPLGCDKQFSEQWGRCGEISFGNKIILCPNCAYEIVKKIGETDGA